MKLNQLDLTKCELQDMLEISHDAMGICSDQEMHGLLLRVSGLVPCGNIIAFLGETDTHATLRGVAKLVNVNYPSEWQGAYLENGYATVDPVLLAHFRRFKPQLWSETYRGGVSGPELAFIEHAGSYGLSEGVTLGQPSKAGALGSLFSFAGEDMGEHPRHMAVLAHLTPHLHVALMRTAFPPSDSRSLLTVREREVLQWMIEGKTNWETSLILCISERTVKFHVQNILAKLQSSTRGQAIALALEQGLVGRPLASLETWLASVCSLSGSFPNPESPPPILRQPAEVL
jgi:DNA-binding CsgD family transcriptional regulator